jgi:hypothetical protein
MSSETLSGGTNVNQSTIPTVIRRTDADGSTRKIIIAKGGSSEELQQRLSDLQQDAEERIASGNYDERIHIDL